MLDKSPASSLRDRFPKSNNGSVSGVSLEELGIAGFFLSVFGFSSVPSSWYSESKKSNLKD